jgi:hypothetical protein
MPDDKLKAYIAEAVRETVNGKIDKQGQEMQKFLASFYEASKNQVDAMKKLDEKIDHYIEQDNKWKQDAQPVIELGQNVRGFGRVFLYILGFITAFAAAIAAITNLIKKND